MRKISLLYLFLALFWTYEVTYLSLFPVEPVFSDSWFNFPHMDKLGHFGFYFGFVFLWNLYFKRIRLKKALEYSFVLAVLYGILMETLQYTMPYERMFDVFDIVANISGAIFASICIKILFPSLYALKRKN